MSSEEPRAEPPEEPCPAPSPAADKRPRGRPRKDGAAPGPRARRKPRSRGKTAVEDEDSTDGLEPAETENVVETEIKEQSAEEDADAEVDGCRRPALGLPRAGAEEPASSLVSVGVEAKISEQLCAFCYCGEKSSLGQGDLKQFPVTPGFQPSLRKDLEDSSAGEKMPSPPARRPRGPRKEPSPAQRPAPCVSVSTQTPPEDQAGKLWDELSLVGLPDAIDVRALFDPTGTCWAHHRCVEWSLGVCQVEEPLLVNVDKAVVSGSTERCAFCKHLGATIRCCEERCTQMYHFPCAASAGTFQDCRHFFLLCPDHIDQAPERSKEDANCAVCDSPGDLLDQFFCTTCGQHYHGMCLDITVTPLKRAGWQCPECKVCQNCKQSGEDSKMLVCDTCDKGYHTFCLQPVMKSVPTNGWKCKNCRVCVVCGTRSSPQWHHNCLVCDSCYQQQDNLCPFCGKCYHPESQKDMLHCNMCRRWVHLECDKPTDHELDSQVKEEYICLYCRHLAAEMDPFQPGVGLDMTGIPSDYSNDMEVDGPEDQAVLLRRALGEDAVAGHVAGQEAAPGIVPDVQVPVGEQLGREGPLTLGPAAESSQDEMNPELENQTSHEVAGERVGVSPHAEPVCPGDQSENKMEVTENLEIFGHQIVPQHGELSSSEAPRTVAPAEAPRPPEAAAADPPEAPGAPCGDRAAVCSQDPPAPGEAAPRESTDASAGTSPPAESAVRDGPCLEAVPAPLPSGAEPALPAAADLGKASASSSPPPPADLPGPDVPQSDPPALSAPAGSVPAAYIAVTPKIGMGKPAITKRKFSPGRPRSKQGAWSAHRALSPPPWAPDISEGRDIFKPRQLPGGAIWSIKVGRGAGFPGRRRPRGAGLAGRGGRGRSKLKSGLGAVVLPGVSAADLASSKEEEENSMHNTVVLFSSSDKFTLHQDMCVVCGSFGQGAEGRLLACSQCGQCYHPYCVSIKITKVVLSKGWRCLECTVCEACGKATDPGRLLLCDDCDISYHTYCLDPPLQTVPKGGWKCKWCVWCRHCGATSAGLRCEWQNNYTQCAPCASLACCPACGRDYREEDLILQCRQCDRWMHAVCQNLNSEEEVENAADMGFDCSMCRPYMPAPNVPSSDCCESSLVAQIVTKVKELDPPKTYTQDGVCLTESGMTQLQSLAVAVPRRKRSKPKLKLKIINQNSVAVLQTPPDAQSEHSRDGEMDDSREAELMDCDGKSESSPEREAADDETKGAEGAEGVKKRKRKPYRPGIGGFMVRQRSRTGQGKAKRGVARKDSSGSIPEQRPCREDGWSEQLPDAVVDESVSLTENTEKIKKRYRKRKNKLEETFPAYLQEAFFGKDLLDTSRQKLPLDTLSEDAAQLPYKTNLGVGFLDPPLDPLLSSSSTPAKPGTQGSADDPLVDISEVLNTDEDILGIISDDLAKSVDPSGLGLCTFQGESTPFPFAGLDVGPGADAPSSLPQPSVTPSSRPLSAEQLDGLLSPELDRMVADGAILGKLYKIPELGGKDVEDLFTAVFSPVTAQPPPPAAPQLLPPHSQDVFSRMPLMNGLIGPAPHLPHNSLPPGNGLGTFSPYADTRDKNPAFNSMANDPHSSWAASTPAVDGDSDTMSNAQRSSLKWEKEEALGEMATVAPVLYTNINFPSLKEEFPDWTTRVKQIAKLWRKASSQERAPYVQKARDNRAALRINKVQMSNESAKRQQQDGLEPGARSDADIFKDPLKQRESEHEQEWKFRQQMRQKSKQQAKIEATQKLEQVKNEQQQQQQQQLLHPGPLPAPPGPDTPGSGLRSPLTPQPPGTPTSAPDDVFLKPQAPRPPPAPSRGPALESLAPPQAAPAAAPHVFPAGRPPRPLSPGDPYVKMVGTPRPPPSGPGFPRRSPAALGEGCGPLPPGPRPCASSPASADPYSKPPDTPRPQMPDPFPKPPGLPRPPALPEQPSRGAPAAGASDPFTKPPLRADVFQRPRVPDPYARPLLTPGPLDGGPFKTPMQPPPSPQDPYGPMSQAPRRLPLDPYDRPPLTPRPVDNFAHAQPGDPYGQPGLPDPLTHPPRPFGQLGAVARPASQDPYAQPPGTPRPVVESYSQPSGTPRPNPDPYSQPPGTPRPPAIDPYSQQPPTPRPPAQADLFAASAASARPPDPYAQPPGTPRPGLPVPYPQPPAAPRPPRAPEGFARSVMARPGLVPSQDPFLQPGPLARPPEAFPQPPRAPGPGLADAFPHGSPSAARDPYEQPPRTPRPQPDAFGPAQVPHDAADQPRPGSEGSFGAPSGSPMNPQGQPFPSGPQLPGPAPPPAAPDTQSTVDTEKMRQRQKLREIILQQQQQKKLASRQEKAQKPPAPAPAPLQHWQPDGVSQNFSRPPPPYPGSLRPPAGPSLGPRYAVFPKDARGPYPPDVAGMGARPHGFRFGFPGGGHGALPGQEGLLVPPQPVPASGVPPLLRRSMSVDMPRPLSSAQLGPHYPQHHVLGQAFIELRHRAPEGRPRLPAATAPSAALEAPPHPRHGSFMPRTDFAAPRQADPVRHASQGLPGQPPAHPGLEPLPPPQQPPGPLAPASSMAPRPLSHPLGADFAEAALPTPPPAEQPAGNLEMGPPPADSLEEKLDADDPSVKDLDVKDLEGVEVKDLDDDDLENLNLDPEDGKGDELDTLGTLEANDPHLDDLLRSGEFDIIAYTDPELDLGDKKGMFSAELDLHVPLDDKLENPCASAEPPKKEPEDKAALPTGPCSPWRKPAAPGEIKAEAPSPAPKAEGRGDPEQIEEGKGGAGTPCSQASAHTDAPEGEKEASPPRDPERPESRTDGEAPGASGSAGPGGSPPAPDGTLGPRGLPGATPVLSSLLAAGEKSDPADSRPSPPAPMPASPADPAPPPVPPPGLALDGAGSCAVSGASRLKHAFPPAVPASPGFLPGPAPAAHGFGPGKPPGQVVPPPLMAPQSRERPLLLEEQPLLLQDLLDQERQEQQQQRQMQAMIRQQRAEPFFPGVDFDAITDPIMKAKMVALKGINKVMAQSNMGMSAIAMTRFPFMGQTVPGAPSGDGQTLLPQAITQDGSITHQISRPNPPNFGPGFVNDAQRQQYEEWLQETQQLLQMQQKYLEEQIGAHRKSKKALSAKQRTAKKAGREFPEEDAEQLKHVTEQQSMVQKQLEQIRKQQKEHAELMEDYRLKQQQHCGPARAQPGFPMGPHPPPGHGGPARMPGLPGWQPAPTPAHLPLAPPRLPAPGAPPSGPPPRVEFDDNNPFSESFQERERQERLREQQERQRARLVQEAERQQARQQRLELAARPPAPPGPFCNFLQPPRALPPSPQHPPPPPSLQGPLGSPPAPAFLPAAERRPVGPPAFVPDAPAVPGGSPSFHPGRPAHGYPQCPPLPAALPATPPVTGAPCGQDPAAGHAHGYPGSAQALLQLYADIIPEEKGRKKRTRKKRKDEDAEPARGPPTPHSDTTAPPTPGPSEAASTPTLSTPGEPPPLPGDPEAGDADTDSKPASADLLPGPPDQLPLPGPEAGAPAREVPAAPEDEVKAESTEQEQSPGPSGPKAEELGDAASGEPTPSGPSPAPAASNELLKHLLKNKKAALSGRRPADPQAPAEGPPTLGAPLHAGLGCGGSQVPQTDGGCESRKQRSKRAQRTGEKAAPRSKRRKKEEEEKQAVYPGPGSFAHLKQQLSLLPLTEPVIGVNFAHFLPYGSGQFPRGSRLLGAFGSGTLDGVSDYYAHLVHKQNNLSNPPTPPASLPPTPPPLACQKMANGFATTEELAGKASVLASHEVTKSLGPKPFLQPFRPHEDLLARAMAQGPKTVDVPASLPTPPHNNQEELRLHDHGGERDSPDSFVPSSSPESVVGAELSRFPDLSLVKQEPGEPVPSPIIPLLPSSAARDARRDAIKAEPGTFFFTPPFGAPTNGPRSGLISVAITLHPTAAENISSVVAAFSDLLHVRIPHSYEVSSAPDVPSVGLVSSHRVNPGMEYRQHLFLRGPPPGPAHPPRLASSFRLKPPSGSLPPASNGLPACKDSMASAPDSAGPRPQWCCHCRVVILGSGVRKSPRDLTFLSKESREGAGRVEKDAVFCSNNCFLLYSSTAHAQGSESKAGSPLLPPSPLREAPARSCHHYSTNVSALDVRCLPRLQDSASPPASPPLAFPPALQAARVEAKPDELKVTVKLKPRLRAVPGPEDCRPLSKKWRGMKWKKWSLHIVIPKGSFTPPGEEEIDEFLQRLGASLKPDPAPRDHRKCCFCHEEGDGLTDGPARLLNLDLDLWVHLNCALWSTEVYETQAGALINVELALRRGLQMKCVCCHRTGATSGCHRFRCANVYHFTCALRAQCMFFKDKTMLCPAHRPKGVHEQELSYFAVFRRVYVQRDEVRQIASVVQRGEREHTFRVGSLIFHAIGQLLPQHMAAFHSPKALFPVGYEASRLYWSTRHAHRRCRYLCSIEEKDGRPVFVIRVLEQGHEDLVLSDSSPKGVWDKILEPVASVRKHSEMLQLFPAYLKGEDLFGLTVSAVARIAESLPGVEACENYTFRYGRNPLMELPLAVNPTGCARSEPKMSAHVKRFVLRPHTLNSTSASKSFQSTVTGELSAPYSKQFVHSKSSQYRKMKTEWKSNVYLARSRIQGLGLYAARDIEKHTMVIEYIGTIIRNEVANRKEKLYESQNRGVYMFRMDNDHVIDATLTGGPARYINHSCAPNCVAEVVTFERGHKIIISSNRRIQKGEELCYDYKFDFEDDQHKIPCHCGAVNCRKWMN
ncbi:histone-lysine N-methyltransferase 2C isoform X4 [Sorex araneus]|uniref:histone-lysine N-methyltransferase 2C isoform X4 n=1 Tax=Sorex araneus TaxID=42254 RepID=UPI002433EDD1|nr:histone-lysine N-methyltransferase 2C isoform X4 [Sorex araneus]